MGTSLAGLIMTCENKKCTCYKCSCISCACSNDRCKCTDCGRILGLSSSSSSSSSSFQANSTTTITITPTMESIPEIQEQNKENIHGKREPEPEHITSGTVRSKVASLVTYFDKDRKYQKKQKQSDQH